MNELATTQPTELAAPQQAPTIEGILQMAVERDMNPDSMERLLAVWEKVQAKRAEQAFSDAMQEFQSKCPTVTRDKQNSGIKNRYASFEHIAETIQPYLDEVGLSYSFDTELSERMLKTICKVRHRDGHREDTAFTILVEKATRAMNEAQASASTNTYGRRYALVNAFSIKIAGEDDDGESAVVKQRDAPDRDASAPVSETRSMRPSVKAIEALANAWKEKYPGADKDAFSGWVHSQMGIPRANALKVSSWDSALLKRAWDTLEATPDPQLKQSEIPF